MSIESPPADATTEQALRERIHRLFCSEGSPARADVPHFWVGPTEEQKNTLSLDIHERIELSDEIDVRSAAQFDEEQWLNSPHIGLEGRSPEAMLSGDNGSRQRLCTFLSAIEAAVRQGSFS